LPESNRIRSGHYGDEPPGRKDYEHITDFTPPKNVLVDCDNDIVAVPGYNFLLNFEVALRIKGAIPDHDFPRPITERKALQDYRVPL
jgi:hypothetical protein